MMGRFLSGVIALVMQGILGEIINKIIYPMIIFTFFAYPICVLISLSTGYVPVFFDIEIMAFVFITSSVVMEYWSLI
jgi:hypothetical protein